MTKDLKTQPVEETAEAKEGAKEQKKLSYAELENVANQLSQQANQLYEQLQRANLTNMFTRLQFLFEVVKLPQTFSGDFYQSCVEEIEQIMNLKAEVNGGVPEGEAAAEDESHEAEGTHID